MSYAIIGFGNIGKALAKSFARTGIDVSVASTRDPESFAPEAAAIGPKVIAKTLAEAVKADIVFLAVRFESHTDVAKAALGEEGQKAFAAMTPLQRMADPAEIGAVAAFLASSDSSFMTGSEVAVDGGLAQL